MKGELKDMDRELCVPNMIMIGAFGRNSGKTEIACTLIRKWSARFLTAALKVTTLPEQGDSFELTDETVSKAGKDTHRLLSAGAETVHWLRAAKPDLPGGFKKFLSGIRPGGLIVCESNSLREYVKPGCFILMRNKNDDYEKQTAKSVEAYADLVLENDAVSTDLENLIGTISVENTNGGVKVSLRFT
jgi:hypothetical protein